MNEPVLTLERINTREGKIISAHVTREEAAGKTFPEILFLGMVKMEREMLRLRFELFHKSTMKIHGEVNFVGDGVVEFR